MINRYETEEMRAIWSLENQYRTWMTVEIAVCEAWRDLGVIPEDAYEEIRSKSDFDVDNIERIESEVHHDVIAFVTDMASHVGESGRYIHLGLTSSDVLDTANALRLKEGIKVLLGQLQSLCAGVRDLAVKHRDTPCVGRSHGIHAEPTTFGLKVLNWYSQLLRDVKRLEEAEESISYGKLSGAVGTLAHTSPEFEEKVCSSLGLKVDPVSTQVIQRDRHAQVSYALASLGCALERIATEVRHLQRTEVLEVLEPFGSKQKGSSAMPHKKNPILCERISGMARLVRSYHMAALENIPLWHERDISHSSVERIAWPDSFHLIHYMCRLMEKVVRGMTVNEARMEKNLDLTGGLVFSQRVLLELVERFGMSREDAYSVVQSNAMRCWDGEGAFIDLLWDDPKVKSILTKEDLEALFSKEHYFRHVDAIFGRFGI
ncbi:adenylosuccinate lyase [Dethiosulfovibrio salsuginis]|uniref:Adenylosuccinate lyase n=1 Tax=Dethiosulfovibrio salsuginis TaxID=561720 RepID=A0A1X7I9M4_9BACT|nr:adenylosuccinate lyase [Dethiosulfovibrio salsuginis]SMG10721.1 Adenylosuccinate lyase [Dethiosulfovibrio salsuginis]